MLVGEFFITVLIQPSQVPLKSFHAASAGVVGTTLSIEVKKSSYSFPCTELFYRIRRSYLDAIGLKIAEQQVYVGVWLCLLLPQLFFLLVHAQFVAMAGSQEQWADAAYAATDISDNSGHSEL